ncbi:hypothetical protein RCL1_004890 [Eukaryota sp. TZLM3-RCL]
MEVSSYINSVFKFSILAPLIAILDCDDVIFDWSFENFDLNFELSAAEIELILFYKSSLVLTITNKTSQQFANTSTKALKTPRNITQVLVLRYLEKQKYHEALDFYGRSLTQFGSSPDLVYRIALCHYKIGQLDQAMRLADEIREHGIRIHPELSIGVGMEGGEVRSVGNSEVLQETALIEAFNLKIAIDYGRSDIENAKVSMSEMPPRNINELDPITLHNMALLEAETDPTSAIKKLSFLLEQPPFPPETLSNLILLQLKHGLHGITADIISENSALVQRLLTRDFLDFVDALITAQSSPQESFRKFDILSGRHVDRLRKLTKMIQDARLSRDQLKMRTFVDQFDRELELYIPVLMAQAKVLWEEENFTACERLLKQSAEFCSENNIWKLNIAHCNFMMETKYPECVKTYTPVVESYYESGLLSVQAIVLANLCVSYILTSQNEEAEDLMKKVEKEEELLFYQNPNKDSFHLCIINLVIGTLYCAKGNFEFGISRVIKSFDPIEKKLSIDTWYYGKRCLAALVDTLAKHWILLKDGIFDLIFGFLEKVEAFGTEMFVNPEDEDPKIKLQTVALEAAMLKKAFLTVRD